MGVVKSADRALWETCLTSRIQRRIDDLTREHADLFDEVRHRAREQAVVELGLAELEAAEARLREDRLALELRQRQIEREQLAVLRARWLKKCVVSSGILKALWKALPSQNTAKQLTC
jgi:hypothetical protein